MAGEGKEVSKSKHIQKILYPWVEHGANMKNIYLKIRMGSGGRDDKNVKNLSKYLVYGWFLKAQKIVLKRNFKRILKSPLWKNGEDSRFDLTTFPWNVNFYSMTKNADLIWFYYVLSDQLHMFLLSKMVNL